MKNKKYVFALCWAVGFLCFATYLFIFEGKLEPYEPNFLIKWFEIISSLVSIPLCFIGIIKLGLGN